MNLFLKIAEISLRYYSFFNKKWEFIYVKVEKNNKK